MASIFDRLQRVFKSAQNTNIDYNKAIYNYLGDSIVWNPENDDTYINKGYRYNPTIYSIVNLISKTAQTIPFQIYEVKNENDLKRYKALTSSDFSSTSLFKADRIQKSALVELQDTELHELLDRPNPAQSYVTWIQEVIAYGKLTGNRYIYGIGPETGNGKFKFKELYVLPSQVMEINSGGIFEPVKSYTLEYNGTVRIDAELICHIKDFNPYYDGTGSHLYGMSPLKAGLRAMDTNNEAVTTGVKYLQNQTARGVLMSDEGDLTETQAKELKRKFKQTYQGSNNAGDVIITPKKLSWVNFGLNASDLSLIEQYNASIKDLCNIYNVPVQLLNNTDSSTYNNMKEAKKALYQNAVMPELVKIREELNRWLTPRFGEKLYIDFDFTAIPELQEEMDKVVGQMSQAWWLTPNEKRSAMSYGIDEDDAKLNDYYVPANLIPLTTDTIDLEPKNIDIDYNELLKAQVPGLPNVYTTVQEAVNRARELGGEGYHSMIHNGGTVYMPFDTHEEFEAIQRGEYDQSGSAYDEDSYDYDEDNDKMIHKQKLTGKVKKALEKKVEDHNEKYGDDPAKKATYSMLAKSFVRGVGAYRTNPSSVRPTVQSEEQWAFARVNGLLYALANGKFKRKPYDTDLLPEDHPLSSKKNYTVKESYNDYPQAATNNARRMIEWREKYGRDVVKGGTEIGWKRASQLAGREKLSVDVISRMAQFNRHRENAKIDPKYKDEPWKDNGYVAWNLWGGTAGVDWAIRKIKKLRGE